VSVARGGRAVPRSADLRERAGFRRRMIERLASADASPRWALPAAGAVGCAQPDCRADLPLFAAMQAREEGAERAATRLPVMPLSKKWWPITRPSGSA
jgi:error-prone DNA polymerase